MRIQPIQPIKTGKLTSVVTQHHIFSQPRKHQRSFRELKGFPAYPYRSCIPGTVGHGHRRHRGVAGHGHGTDGGSTRHHVWRRGVDHLGSTSDRKCCRFINRNAEKVNNRTVKLPQTSANENMGIKPVEGL